MWIRREPGGAAGVGRVWIVVWGLGKGWKVRDCIVGGGGCGGREDMSSYGCVGVKRGNGPGRFGSTRWRRRFLMSWGTETAI